MHWIDYDSPRKLKHLIAETWSSTLLDCGASKTVCGKEWLNQYWSNLPKHEQPKITFTSNNHVCRFGDGRRITTIENITSTKIRRECINIQFDILDKNILLLFSRSSTKKAEMKITFQNNTINTFGKNIPLVTTSRGHYAKHTRNIQ